MIKQNLTDNTPENNHVLHDAYACAVEHIGWCMWQGFEPWQVMASVGVPAPIDASWNQALGVIWSKSMEVGE